MIKSYRKKALIPMKILAFLKRDVQIDLSYKLRFIMQFIGIFFSTALTFFVSELIGSGISPTPEQAADLSFDFKSLLTTINTTGA